MVYDLMIHDIDLVLALIAAPVRSVAAVGLCLFGEHEDVANARIEFEDGTVANLTASRASYSSIRKMRIWGMEGYASLDFAAKHATLVRPSEQLKDGRLELEGVNLTRPAAVKEHLFGKVLRVDQIQSEGNEPLALELEDFVNAARGLARPRVSGEDALRDAAGLADRSKPGGTPLGPRARDGGGSFIGPPGPSYLATQEPAAKLGLTACLATRPQLRLD